MPQKPPQSILRLSFIIVTIIAKWQYKVHNNPIKVNLVLTYCTSKDN